jgi:hypothetical protein
LPVALLVFALSLALGVGGALAVAPTISSTGVSAVTTKAAVLEAGINPGSEATTYHFEYGLADCSVSSCTATPVPNDNVGSDSSVVKVTREIAGLTPGTTYHFRVVASNGSGPATGPDRTFRTYAVPSLNTSCANRDFRTGPAATMLDCRAYEMVSPVDKNGGDIFTHCNITCYRTAHNQSSTSGDKFTYSAYTAFGDSVASRYSNQYIATRGSSGWSTHSITLPQGKTTSFPGINTSYGLDIQFKAFTDDLSNAWVTDYNDVPLAPGGIDGNVNLVRRDNSSESFESLTRGVLPHQQLGGSSDDLLFGGASDDLSHQVFSVRAQLTPDALGADHQVYDLSGGQLHLVSVLPDGSASLGQAVVGRISSDERAGTVHNAVSEDGSHVFWSDGYGVGGSLFVRINNQTTIPVWKSTSSEDGARFESATPDGSSVIFSVGDAFNTNRDLYRFDVDTETRDLVTGDDDKFVGASEDGSLIYFTSSEVLDTGATAGEINLYLDDEGVKTFIATLPSGELENALQGRVTPDGRNVAFTSTGSLTGYDNTDAVNGKADVEVYVYDAATEQLSCASCNPSGARPVGKALQIPFYALPSGQTATWAAAWFPKPENDHYTSHVLSDGGNRLFFNSFDALLPGDTNGAQDVYEWEAQDSGTCEEAGGCLSLISTGESPKRSEFIDASPDGRDVFFETSSSIDPRDPGLIDIYNARAGGGYPPPTEPPPCVGDACQGIPAAPNDPTPASAGFRGAGDPQPKKAQRCRARNRKTAKVKGSAMSKKAKRCTRAKRGAKR